MKLYRAFYHVTEMPADKDYEAKKYNMEYVKNKDALRIIPSKIGISSILNRVYRVMRFTEVSDEKLFKKSGSYEWFRP